MKKALLTLGVAIFSMNAFAANMLPAGASNFDNGEKNGWSSWGNGSSSSVVEGGYNSTYCLELVNPKAGDDYYVAQAAYDIDLPEGDYKVSFYAKSAEAGGSVQFAYQNSTTYAGAGYTTFELTTEWTLCEKEFTVTAADMNRILISFGKVEGTFYIDDVVLESLSNQDSGENPAGVPADAQLLFSGNTADGTLIVEWKDELTNGTHDGKDCIVYENATAVNSYDIQLAFDYNYIAGEMYYLTFDVMGTPSTDAIGAWYQHKSTYSALGYSDFNTFSITSDSNWTPVVLKGKYTANEEVGPADRIVINLGEYVGTAYFTNFKVYGPDTTSGVGAVEAVEAAPAGVYNLMGVKVAGSLEGLAPGLYIVGGKKVLVRQ